MRGSTSRRSSTTSTTRGVTLTTSMTASPNRCFDPMTQPGRRRSSRGEVMALMSVTTKILPILESCDGCGACCRVVSRPPFHRLLDETAEDTWERLKWERPDLVAELLADDRARRADGGPYYG